MQSIFYYTVHISEKAKEFYESADTVHVGRLYKMQQAIVRINMYFKLKSLLLTSYNFQKKQEYGNHVQESYYTKRWFPSPAYDITGNTEAIFLLVTVASQTQP